VKHVEENILKRVDDNGWRSAAAEVFRIGPERFNKIDPSLSKIRQGQSWHQSLFRSIFGA
jgi:hypothetical protein